MSIGTFGVELGPANKSLARAWQQSSFLPRLSEKGEPGKPCLRMRQSDESHKFVIE